MAVKFTSNYKIPKCRLQWGGLVPKHCRAKISGYERPGCILTVLWTDAEEMVTVFFVCVCVWHHRRPIGWEEASLPHPIWPLQLQDGVERTGAGDGVHCRRTVSERILHYFCPESLKWPPARVSSSSLFSSFNPGPPLKSPGPKWAVISQPSAHPSCTTRRPCVLWTCQNQTQEITAVPLGIDLVQCTTPSMWLSKVCLWWSAKYQANPHWTPQSLLLSVISFCSLPPSHNWFMHRCQQGSVFTD